jgi:hypothetical protein
MPRIFTRPSDDVRSNVALHFHGSLWVLARKQKNERRLSVSSIPITPERALQRGIISLALGLGVQHRCSL